MPICKVVGVTFKSEEHKVNRQDVIKKLSGKEKIYLKREPKNKFDRNAVAVMLKRGDKFKDFKLGYIRAEVAGIMAELWHECKFIAKIAEIRTGDLKTGVPYGMSISVKKIKKDKLKNRRK